MNNDLILVTGSSGNVGKEVIRHLQNNKLSFKAGIRKLNESCKCLFHKSNLIEFDFNNKLQMEHSLKDISKVFLLFPDIPEIPILSNNFLNAVKNSPVEHIVLISASGANSQSDFSLLQWHGKVIDTIKQSQIPITILFPSHFYQNYLHYTSIKSNNTIALPQGNAKKTMIDTYDIGEAVSNIFMNKTTYNQSYILGGYDYNNFEIASILSKYTKKEIQYNNISSDEYKNILQKQGIPHWKIEILLKLNLAWKSGSRLKTNEQLREIIQRNPRSFEEFVIDHIENFK